MIKSHGRGGCRCCLALLAAALLFWFSSPAAAQDCAYVGNQLVGTVRILEVPGGGDLGALTLPGCSAGFCQLTDIAVVPAAGMAYVSQLDGNRVWAVDYSDPDNPTEPVSIPVSTSPSDLVLSPGATSLYVVSLATSEIATLDLATGTETNRFAAPSQPRGLAITPAGDQLATASRNQNSVFLVDPSDGDVIQSGTVGERPSNVALSPDGARLFATSDDGILTVVDAVTGDVLDTFVVGSLPAAVVVAADGGTAYVANRGSNSLSVVDLNSRQVDEIAVGRAPVALAISPGGMLLVANLQDGTLSVIDTLSEDGVLPPIAAGVSPFALAAAECPPWALATPTPGSEGTQTPLVDTPTPEQTPTDSPDETPTETLPTGTPTAGPMCVGDCNGDGNVAINELIIGVNISLRLRDVADCRAFDENNNGNVEISELIRGVNNSLGGCPS